MGYGFASHIGIVLENSLAVLGGARTDFMKVKNEGIQLNIERFQPVVVHGSFAEPDDEAGIKGIEGDIVMYGHPESFGHFLAAVMGVSSTVEVTSGFLYQHTMTPRTVALGDFDSRRPNRSFSVEVYRHDVASAFIYRGMIPSKVSLNLQPNQDLQLTTSFIGIAVDIGSKSTPTFPGSPTGPFVYHQSSVTVDGVAVKHVEQLTMEVDDQLSALPVARDSDEAWKIKRGGPQTIKVSGVSAFDDFDLYDKYVNQTEFALKVNVLRANSFSALFNFGRMVLTSAPIVVPGAERLTYSWEAMARTPVGSHALIVDLTNTRSGYLV